MGPNSLRLMAAGVGAIALAVALVWTGERLSPDGGPAEASGTVGAGEADRPTVETNEADTLPSDTGATEAPPAAARVDYFELGPDGRATVAGRTRPGAGLVLLLDGDPVARLEAGADGSFVAFPQIAASDRLRPLTFEVDGVASGSDTIFVQPGRGSASADTDSGDTLALADDAMAEEGPLHADPTRSDIAGEDATTDAPSVTDRHGLRAAEDPDVAAVPVGVDDPRSGASLAGDGAGTSGQGGAVAEASDVPMSEGTVGSTQGTRSTEASEATTSDPSPSVADGQGPSQTVAEAPSGASDRAVPGDPPAGGVAAPSGSEALSRVAPDPSDTAAPQTATSEASSMPSTTKAAATDGRTADAAMPSVDKAPSVDDGRSPASSPAGSAVARSEDTGADSAVAVADGLSQDDTESASGRQDPSGDEVASRPAALDGVSEGAPAMAQDIPAQPGATETLVQDQAAPRPAAGDGRDLGAPPALIVTADGVRSVAPQVMDRVALDAISYDDSGEVRLAGRGPATGALQVYLDNRPVTSRPLAPTGGWQLTLDDVSPGTYTLRIDQLDASGAVASRIETPFLKEDPAAVRALRTEAPGAVRQIRTRTVQPGATLWAIATDRFDDGMMYVAIYQANRDQIRDPDLIYPGQVFVLPEAAPVGIPD